MKISKYQNRILAMVTFFVFFFGLITVIYSDSYQNTLEEQRKKLYGSWNIASYHTSDDEIQTLEKNATIDKVGKVEVLGDILDREGDNIGAIGSADNSFFSLGNIKTLSGHMPRNANEIAIEASYLTRLGYSYELGQNIHLNILFYDKEGNEQIGVYQFVLTGVIKNYSSYWKTQNNELPSFFITKRKSIGTNKNGTITKHIFISLKEKYKEEADALQVLCQRGEFVKNDYVYGEYSGGRLFILERNMLQFFILGIISALMNLSMYLFGNVDYLLKAFFSVIVIDFLTGILRAIKRHEFSFSVVALGFIKKLGYMAVVITSVIMGSILNMGNTIRDMVIYTFVFNEIISILGNCKELGIIMPSILQKSLDAIKEKLNK